MILRKNRKDRSYYTKVNRFLSVVSCYFLLSPLYLGENRIILLRNCSGCDRKVNRPNRRNTVSRHNLFEYSRVSCSYSPRFEKRFRVYSRTLVDQTHRINNNYIAAVHRGVEKCPLETKRKCDRFSSRSIFLLHRCSVNIKGERSYSINSVINVRELSLHEYQRDTRLSSCNPTLHAAGGVA